jgi:NDP-sugar pyrophosphorylase family protein
MGHEYEELKIEALYGHPEHSIAWSYRSQFVYPWEALSGLTEYIRTLGNTLSAEKYERRGDDVWVARTANVAPTAYIGGPTAYIGGPCIICEGAEIRHCAFIRGSAIVGAGAVVGNSTELKNCILFDGVQIPHFNYCGDSILGYKAHMAAGVITSNVKSDKTNVSIRTEDGRIETGLRKLGALVGDCVEIGCNTVLNPGTVIGRNTTVYPLSRVRGMIPAGHIYKSETQIVPKREK